MEAKLQRLVQRYGWDKSAPFDEGYWQRQLEPVQTQLLAMANLHRDEPTHQAVDI